MNNNFQQNIDAAINWLTGAALVKDNQPVGSRGQAMELLSWNGSIRGEYMSTVGSWNSFCPIWHTGQAVKALVMHNKIKEAEYCADFILANQITSGEDTGLLLAFEDDPKLVNTSAVMEALDGLFMLSEKNGDSRYADAAIAALDWTARKMWNPESGKFRGTYDVKKQCCVFNHVASIERPLLDDAVFITGWRYTSREDFKQIAINSAETLLREEHPEGNWLKYIPCVTNEGLIHPRHAYWWGRPMLSIYQATGDKRFLNCFKRSADWYKSALRLDGGLFRHTGTGFNSWSFGHSTSGSACAALVLADCRNFFNDDTLTPYIDKALEFCLSMQFNCPENENLHGAILEKVLPPDGSIYIPYQLRDLGTIFFLQAAAFCK